MEEQNSSAAEKYSGKDRRFMQRALVLARRGSGFTRPNPMVGAVLVKDGAIIGEGWHEFNGGPHAEINAISAAGGKAPGAALYVTLEPCNHFGKTPPCTDAVLAAGIKRIVVAMRDPNPNVAGQGIEKLRAAGVEVGVGLLSEQAQELNAAWIHWVITGKPYIALKLNLSLDGRVSFPDGSARWLSSPVSRAQLQRMRRHVDAVMIGAESVLADDPALTNRTGKGCQPLRIVLDPRLEVPPGARVYRALPLQEKGPNPIALVVTTSAAGFQARRRLELHGVDTLVLEDEQGGIDLVEMLAVLGKRGVQAVLCEGDARSVRRLLVSGLCQRLLVYRIPVTVGPGGGELFEESGIPALPPLRLLSARRVGLDALSIYEVQQPGVQGQTAPL